MLYGRTAECAAVDRLLEDARSGRSGVLVLRGEAGVGKSTLLGYAAERAEGGPAGLAVLRPQRQREVLWAWDVAIALAHSPVAAVVLLAFLALPAAAILQAGLSTYLTRHEVMDSELTRLRRP